MQGDICMWKPTKPCCITNKPILCMTCLLNCAWMCLVYLLPFSANFNILKSFCCCWSSERQFDCFRDNIPPEEGSLRGSLLHVSSHGSLCGLCGWLVTDCSIYFTTTAKKINAVLVPFKTHNGNIIFTSQETFLTQKNYLAVCKEKQSLPGNGEILTISQQGPHYVHKAIHPFIHNQSQGHGAENDSVQKNIQ